MRVLVTGGAGFIGSHIVDALLLRGHEVWVVDDLSSGQKINIPAVRFWACDIAYSDGFLATVETICPDAICHQAAQPSLRRSIDNPPHDALVNIVGTINVIQAAKACGAHVVFASTSAVYDPAGGAFTEDSPIGPNLPYGIAKATAEQYLRHSGVSYTILRYGNVYGPRQIQVGENQLIPHCLAYILDGKPFVINGDGEQTRDFVYVEDIARANVLALESRISGTFNCGVGLGRDVNTVCQFLARIAGRDVIFEYGPAKPGEARRVTLDSERAAAVLGWCAETTLVDGLRRTVAWWKEHNQPVGGPK
jgi:UDP-glucose 4-epimerase